MSVKRRMMTALIVLLCIGALAAKGEADLNGYDKSRGYDYVLLGTYPYERDGTEAPVLWRVLDSRDGKALLLTEYVIDGSQVIFETNETVIENRSYRKISTFRESDLYTYLNTEALDRLLGDDPMRQALLEDEEGGKLSMLTSEQYLTQDYGFSNDRWDTQPTRFAKATPYAQKAKGVYVDDSNRNASYWTSTVRSPEGYQLQLVGYDGHLSWGAYTRVNVGLRLSVRLDLSRISISGGQGTKNQPYLLSYAGEAESTSTEAPAETPVPTEAPAETQAPAEKPASTEAPAEEPAAAETPALAAQTGDEGESILMSFVGDCSIGDAIQYRDYSGSYHTVLADKGYDWPFSLVKEYFEQDDWTVANLEAVLTARKSHADKMFPLVGDPSYVDVLTAGSIEMVNTVNNHCMDFHEEGYLDTLANLKRAGVRYFGSVLFQSAPEYDWVDAVEIKGVRVGFAGFTYPKDEDYELRRIAKRISLLKEDMQCDLVVVSLHWGRENHSVFESWQAKFAARVIDAGADLIWGHHPHVLQPIQVYKGKLILYSTGNFTFGTMSQVDPSTGIFQIAIEKNDGQPRITQLRVIPCRTQGSGDFRPYELTDPQERRAVFKKLTYSKTYYGMENLPASFLDSGIVRFDENGHMLP